MDGKGDSLADFRATWESKPVLRAIYEDYYEKIRAACNNGRTLEVGSGSGNFASSDENVVAVDVQYADWLDIVADATALPFSDAVFSNIVLVDVLHHIEYPVDFFREAERIMEPGGRVIMLEPAITPVSGIFYRFLHPEPVSMQADPFATGARNPDRSAYDANQAISSLMFGRFLGRFEEVFPEFKLLQLKYLSLFAYPLSGGFRRWALIPNPLVKPMLRFEDYLLPFVGRLAAFRMFVVLERR